MYPIENIDKSEVAYLDADELHPILTGLLALLVVLQFCQFWPEVGGFTFRFETILIFGLLLFVLMPSFIHKPHGSFRTPFTLPVLVWIGVLMFGVTYTLLQPLPQVVKKDALVNGIRLALSFSTFFVVLRFPLPPRKKLKIVLASIVGISLITTAVAVAQIVYHDGWFSISLPHFLTEHKIGANTALGREIFGLNIGDTSGHSFASFVAIQAACVFYWLGLQKSLGKRWFAICYTAILFLIVIRISVRAAALGFVFGFVAVNLFAPSQKQGKKIRFLLVAFGGIILICGLIMFLFEYAPQSYYIYRIADTIPQLQHSTISFNRGSNIYGRFLYWQIAIDSFIHSPFIGAGFYTFSTYGSKFFNILTCHAHNGYMHTLAEFGMVGVCALLLMFRGVRRMWRVIATYQSSDVLFLSSRRFLLWFFSFMLFTSMFANTFYQPQYISTLYILFGALVDYVLKEHIDSVK